MKEIHVKRKMEQIKANTREKETERINISKVGKTPKHQEINGTRDTFGVNWCKATVNTVVTVWNVALRVSWRLGNGDEQHQCQDKIRNEVVR